MKNEIAHIALVVDDYDEAIDFYCNTLDFELKDDTYQPEQDKRWVVVAPPGSRGSCILLAQAANEEQKKAVGNQCGQRVFLFLCTDDFDRDFKKLQARGVNFIREPSEAEYGKVAVFEDLYGNKWDLLQMSNNHWLTERLFTVGNN